MRIFDWIFAYIKCLIDHRSATSAILKPFISRYPMLKKASDGAQAVKRALESTGLSPEASEGVVADYLLALIRLRIASGQVTDMESVPFDCVLRQNEAGETVIVRGAPFARVKPLPSDIPLAEAEKRLGVKFPYLFHRIYTEIGNGHFGPGYGLRDLQRIIEDTEYVRETYTELVNEYPALVWPSGLVYLGTEGCTYEFYLDTTDPNYRVIMFSDSHYRDRLEEGMLVLAESFEDWIGHWAAPYWAAKPLAVKHEIGDISFPAH